MLTVVITKSRKVIDGTNKKDWENDILKYLSKLKIEIDNNVK